MVDDLSHEVGEKDGLSDDGEPGEQVTGAQSQQLRRHLQHGQPQQPHCGLNLKRAREEDYTIYYQKETLNTVERNDRAILFPWLQVTSPPKNLENVFK